MGLGQRQAEKSTDGCQDGEKYHYFEIIVDAGVYDLRWDHHCYRPKCFYEANSDNSYLRGVELVQVYCVEIEGIADNQLDEKQETQNYDIRTDIGHFGFILVPDENEDNRAGHNNAKRCASLLLPRQFVDCEVADHARHKLGGLNGCSVEKYVEIELVEHEGGGQILQGKYAV